MYGGFPHPPTPHARPAKLTMVTALPEAPPLQLKNSGPVLLLLQPERAGTPGRGAEPSS